MKKTLLLALGLGTAMAASAAVPNYLQHLKANANLPQVNLLNKTAIEGRTTTNLKVNDLSKVKPVERFSVKAEAASALQAPLYAPLGLYYEGLGTDYKVLYNMFMVCPPFTDVAYANASGQKTSLWAYGIGDETTAGGDSYTSTDQNLVVNYPITFSSAPKLTVADGSAWQAHSYDQNNSDLNFTVVSTGLFHSGKAPASIAVQPFNLYWAVADKKQNYYFGSDCKAGADGVATLFPEPAVPYCVLQARMLFLDLNLKNDAELTLNVYEVAEDGSVSDTKYAVGKAGADDITKVAEGLYAATFTFYKEDDLGGLTETVLYPESDLIFQLTGFKDNSNISFSSVCFNWPFLDDEQTTDIVYPYEVGYLTREDHYVPFSKLFEGVHNSPCLFLDGYMGGIELDKTDNHFADNGGSVELSVTASPEYLFTDYAENIKEYLIVENEIPDWLSISVSYDETSGTKFQIEADPLPAGVTGRRADISFSTALGGREVFVATQGDASVAGVEATNSKVSVVDGNFVVESDNATSVAVYNLAGQKVAEAAFAGKATVPAADLAKGVYVVKFNDNTVVKVAK